MAKIYKVVDRLQPGTSTQGLETDWCKYVLCQEDTSEVLHCPPESTHATQGAGYKTIAELLIAFDRICCLPTSIFQGLMMGMALKKHDNGTRLSGTTHVGSSTAEQNYMHGDS